MNTNSNLKIMSICIVQRGIALGQIQREITRINGDWVNTLNGSTIMFHLTKIVS
jgi:hypothetical protein